MNPLRTPFACRLNQRNPIHIGSDDQAKGPRWAAPKPRFRRGDGADMINTDALCILSTYSIK
jgi:hypothetical protein